MFLAHISPLGRALVDKRLYLPESWSKDPERCRAVGAPEDEREYRSKTELVLEMLERALAQGHMKAGWVAGDDALGVSPSFRETLAALGMRYVLDVPAGFTAWPAEPEWTRPEYQGWGAPQALAQCRTMEQSAAAMPEGAWQEITVAQARVCAVTCSAPRGCDRPAGASRARSTWVPGPQRPSPPPCMEGAWQLHPLGFVGKTPDYTAKVNLIEKVLDFDQLGGV